jgi:LruC domain-containing protein
MTIKRQKNNKKRFYAMRKLLRVSAFMLTAGALLVGCNQDNSAYDPSTGEINNPMSSITIPDGFNFSTTKVVKATVKVNDQFNGKSNYGVYLYGDDPASTTVPTPLATGNAKSGTNFTASITVPAASKYLYVKTVTPNNLYDNMAFAINSDNTVNADFTAANTNAAKATRGTMKKTIPTITIPTTEYPEMPTNLTELTSTNNQTVSGNSYKVSSSVSVGGNNGQDCTFYVSNPNGDAVKISGLTNMNIIIHVMPNTKCIIDREALSSSTITVDNGAELSSTFLNFELNNSSKLFNRGTVTLTTFADNISTVVNEGTFNVTHLKPINQNSLFCNKGTLNVSMDLTLSGGGTFYNDQNAVATVTTGTTLQNDGDVFINRGHFTTNYMDISAATKDNHNDCYMKVNTYFKISSQCIFTMDAGSYIECNRLQVTDNATLKLDANAYILASGTDLTNIQTAGTGIIGISTTNDSNNKIIRGYADLGVTTAYSCNSASNDKIFDGPLYIHTANAQNIAQSGINISNGNDYIYYYKYNSSSVGLCTINEYPDITISKTDCNPGVDHGKTPTPVAFTKTFEGVYAMEDNYPSYGDYDMNDIVVYMRITGQGSDQSTNLLQKATVTTKVLAYGVDYTNGYGLQLNKIAFTGTGVESNTNGSVLMLADNVKGYYRVKTDRPATLAEAITTVTDSTTNDITFTTPINADSLNTNNVNFFSTVDKGSGATEIHLKGYKHTGNADRQHITVTSGNVDNRKENSIDCFETFCGSMWGMYFAKDSQWLWPYEHNGINKVYTKFGSWVESNGKENTDWYDYRTE